MDLQQDCGKSFFTQFQGGEPYSGRLQPKNNNSEHKLQQQVHTCI